MQRGRHACMVSVGAFSPFVLLGPNSSALPLFLLRSHSVFFSSDSIDKAMSSIVCQGLQSCLEPRLVEPRVSRHKLAPPKSISSPSFPCPQKNSNNEENNNKTGKRNNNSDLGAWSFIQALSNTSHNHKEVTENEKVYVDPLAKRSSSMLSMKSLEMCTESLGSETGSDISESSDEFCSLSSQTDKFQAIKRSKSREFTKNLCRSRSFPPPLSSICGLDSVQVRPHREGGRLVIKAVTVSSCSTYFQAERIDGRLRLCLLKDCSLNCHKEVARDEEKVNNEEEHDEEHENDDKVEDVDDDDAGGGDEVDDDHSNRGKVGCEIGIGELPRPSRCKEGGASGNKGMSNWEPFWVAIS
ncbi:hypothetical protein F0562_021273 [Nyssa sinensis]|uniref:FAF domain-containing protein n=1 Tax=Nyssa sinensis TaxID=561372 RepID=A0A5J5BNA9_9ASTE|nr:hypothetical protein F0562_021273 [Nyssa sinensis]